MEYELWRKFKKVQTLNKEKKRPILRVKRHRKKNSTALKSNARLQSINRSFVEKTSNICIFFPKLFWPSVRKNCSSNWEPLLKFEAEGGEFDFFFLFLQSQKTIYSLGERSEQFSEQNAFLTYFWRFLRSNTLEQL